MCVLPVHQSCVAAAAACVRDVNIADCDRLVSRVGRSWRCYVVVHALLLVLVRWPVGSSGHKLAVRCSVGL
jgi:hypothetical protein